LAAPRC
jgi:hypothetical protein